MNLITTWFLTALAFLLGAYILPGVEVQGFGSALLAALVLGVINAFIRPLLALFMLPITILTLGLFSFVINSFMILLTDSLVAGFDVAGFGSAFVFAIVLSLLTWVLGALFPDEKVTT